MLPDPKLSTENDGGMAAVELAAAGLTSTVGVAAGTLRVSKNELNRGLVRILRGISSTMEENVSRWSIKLFFGRKRGSALVKMDHALDRETIPVGTEIIFFVCIQKCLR